MLKIAKPNEFDLVFKLKFPYYKSIAVTRDPKIPGNVLLDMTRVLELLKDDPREDFQRIRELIQGRLVDAQNFFVVDRLRSWLQSLFSQALNRISYRVELVAGVVSHLKYRTCGPAHTIYVYGDYEYSVDYVPAICLAAEQNVLPTKQLECFKRANTSYWEAIPKPLKPLTETSMISFRSSFYAVEKILLQDVHENCRNAIRFMKKFRDVKTNLGNCKSYYIKTLFLWKIIQEPESYWLNPLSFILADMFDDLAENLRRGVITFFWDPELNMIDALTRDQVWEMYLCVQRIPRDLRGAEISRNKWSFFVLREFSHKKERNVNLKCSSRRKRNVIKGLKTTSICKLRNARTNGTWTAGLWTRPGHAYRGPSETVSTWDTVKDAAWSEGIVE
nr:cGAS-like receptor 2, isoform D [Drosophila melanogaster]ABV53908.1 cGAS-like receptor 2, isoform D [Drosophila melanogaster]|eukprot:NP_001097455.1 uncharacterized protein Dmel_CG30424, isoform D [Drosophila melanogaster]